MLQSRPLRNDAIEIWKSGLNAVDARTLVKKNVLIEDQQLRIGPKSFPIDKIENVVVVGFGKASGAMAVGLEEGILTDSFVSDLGFNLSGLICVPDDRVVQTKHIKIVGGRPAGENLPTERVQKTTGEILNLIESTGPNDVCVCLVSGGGSALLELPIEPITIDEFRSATSFLSGSGASIYQLNAVRRAISSVKGGSLARAAGQTPIVSLIISDVIGDNLDVISSGPTVQPTSTASAISAIEVLQTFDPDRTGIPSSIWEAIESNSKPVVEFEAGAAVDNFIIGNIETAIEAAKEKAIQLGYACELGQPSGNEGDAETIGRQVPAHIEQLLSRGNKQCFIQGGETTVKLCDNPGHGGRNQHLVLAAIDEFVSLPKELIGDFCLLSGGTDGEDGSAPESGIAGAIADREAIQRIGKLKTDDVKSALLNCNSFEFHLAQDNLLRVGSDGNSASQESGAAKSQEDSNLASTNVCDLRIVLAEAD